MRNNYYDKQSRKMFDLMTSSRDLTPHEMPTFAGCPVDATILVPEFERRWEFPYRRFVTFEKNDESWARRLGFGREIVERVVYKVGNTLMMHPNTLEAFLEAANLQTSGSQV